MTSWKLTHRSYQIDRVWNSCTSALAMLSGPGKNNSGTTLAQAMLCQIARNRKMVPPPSTEGPNLSIQPGLPGMRTDAAVPLWDAASPLSTLTFISGALQELKLTGLLHFVFDA